MNSINRRGSSTLLVLLWLAVLLLAGWLRFSGIDQQGLQHWDEGAYTAGPLQVGPYGRAAIVPFYAPPLFPALVHLAFLLFGVSDTVAIATAGVLSCLSIAALGLLASRLFGRAVGLVSGLFLATAEYHIAYGRMALTDAPFLFFFLLALWVFHLALERRHRGLFVLGGLTSGLALLVKYHGFLPFAMAGLFMVIEVVLALIRRQRQELRMAVARLLRQTGWSLAGFLPVAALLLIYIHQTVGLGVYLQNRSQWVAGISPWAFKSSLLYISRAFGEWLSPLLLVLALAGLAGLIHTLFRADRVARRRAGYFLCWMVPFAIAIPFYKNYPRLLLPLVAAVAVLAAIGIQTSTRLLLSRRHRPDRPGMPGPALGCAVAVILGLATAASGIWQARDTLALHPTGYRDAAREITTHLQPGSRVLLLAQHTIFFYLRDLDATCLSHNEEVGVESLRNEDFDLLAVDLRRQHTPAFRSYLDGPGRSQLKLVATVPNPLYDMTLVNSGGFDLLDAMRTHPDSPEAVAAATIRIYMRKDLP